MASASRHQLRVDSRYQPIFRELGIDAEAVFDHPLIKPWRALRDRENCTLDAMLADGRTVRFHVKRYAPSRGARTPADAEVAGQRLLAERSIPTVELVAWGTLADRRSFVILEDLHDYTAADRMVADGLPFAKILEPTAQLAGNLHGAGLHHRDLYLCHFFAKLSGDAIDVRLIDTARVRELPRLLRQRWIVKDLAEFWYSTTRLPVSEQQRWQWLDHYLKCRGSESSSALRRRIERKAALIARHDARVRASRPHRNISIPRAP